MYIFLLAIGNIMDIKQNNKTLNKTEIKKHCSVILQFFRTFFSFLKGYNRIFFQFCFTIMNFTSAILTNLVHTILKKRDNNKIPQLFTVSKSSFYVKAFMH